MLWVPLTRIWGRGTLKGFPSNCKDLSWVSFPSSGGTCWMSLLDKSNTASIFNFFKPSTSITLIWFPFSNNVSNFSQPCKEVGIEINLLKDKHISRRFVRLPISNGNFSIWLLAKLRYCSCFPFSKIEPGSSLHILLWLKFNSNNFPIKGSIFCGNSVR